MVLGDGGPLEPSGDGRDTNGRFAPGNRAGRGNPFGKKVAALRGALFDALTEDDVRSVVQSLVTRAKRGDVPAIRELLLRALGRPLEFDLLERLDAIEAELGLGREAADRPK